MATSASTPTTAPELTVAIGIVRGDDGSVLLSRRKPGGEHGGRWEFPGGKLQDGESAADALKRELREELSVEVTAARHCMTTTHQYAAFAVQLEVFGVARYNGQARGAEGQELRWVKLTQLTRMDLLEGSEAVVKFLLRGGDD